MATLQHAKNLVQRKERGFLGGYHFNAPEIRFANQNPKEQVFIMLRAHPITNLGWIVRLVVWMLLPLIVGAFLAFVRIDLNDIPLYSQLSRQVSVQTLGILIAITYYAGLVTSGLISFLDWYYNLYLVTNERIVDFNYKPLVSYEIVEAKLENIENVKEKSVGFIPSLFGYGDIIAQTAGQNVILDFLSVPKPTRVRDIIADLSSFAKRVYATVISNPQ